MVERLGSCEISSIDPSASSCSQLATHLSRTLGRAVCSGHVDSAMHFDTRDHAKELAHMYAAGQKVAADRALVVYDSLVERLEALTAKSKDDIVYAYDKGLKDGAASQREVMLAEAAKLHVSEAEEALASERAEAVLTPEPAVVITGSTESDGAHD